MSSIPAYQSGLLGIQRGLNSLNRHAADIASANQFNNSTTSNINLTESLVGLKQSEIQVAISAKVLEAASDTIGTLLDVIA